MNWFHDQHFVVVDFNKTKKPHRFSLILFQSNAIMIPLEAQTIFGQWQPLQGPFYTSPSYP